MILGTFKLHYSPPKTPLMEMVTRKIMYDNDFLNGPPLVVDYTV